MKFQKKNGDRIISISVVERRDNFLSLLFCVPEVGVKGVMKLKNITFEIIDGNILPCNV